MSVYMTKIAALTSDGTYGNMLFSNIPQTYAHLLIKLSLRSPASGGMDSIGIIPNGDNTSTYRSSTQLYATGAGVGSHRSTYRNLAGTSSAVSTSNTFTSAEIFIPNYAGANFKQLIVESVSENNAASTYIDLIMTAFLWRSTSAITSIALDNSTSGQAYVLGSTATLYGIKNS